MMSSQTLLVDVSPSKETVNVYIEQEVLQLEALISVVSPAQIVLLHEIRSDSESARDRAIDAELIATDAANSASSSADDSAASEAGAAKSEAKALEYRNTTGDYKDQVVDLHGQTTSLRDETKALHGESEAFRNDAESAAGESQASADVSVSASEASEVSAAASLTSATAALASETAAAESAVESESSRQASDASASEAKSSEISADASASDSAESADESSKSAVSSAQSAEQSADSQAAAKTSETAAAESQVNAKASEAAAASSAIDAQESADESEASNQASAVSAAESLTSSSNSADSADAAKASEIASQTSADQSLLSAEHSQLSADDAADSQAAALESQTAAKDSETNSKASEVASADSQAEAKASEEASKASELASKASEEASAESQLASKESEVNAIDSASKALESEQNAFISAESAAESRQASELALDGAIKAEDKADEHAQMAGISEVIAGEYRDDAEEFTAESKDYRNDSRRLKRLTAQLHQSVNILNNNVEYVHDQVNDLNDQAAASATKAKEAQSGSESARDLSRRWATEAEDVPVEGDEFSSLHWAKIAERFASTLTSGMYFAGQWDLADGFPPEPDEPQVPWYRIVNNDVSGIRPLSSDLKKLARQSNKGDQLVWDPIAKEWFLIDTSDEVWLVNNKKGNVVLDADDVGALPLSGGILTGSTRITGTGFRYFGLVRGDKEVRFGSGYEQASVDYYINNEHVSTLRVGDTIRVREGVNGGLHRIYHGGNKPTASEIGALGTTGDQELSGAILPRVQANDADNLPDSWGNGYSLSTVTSTGGYAAWGTLNTFRSGSGRTSQILCYPDVGVSKMRFRVADPDDDSWYPWAELYSSQNKPTKADIDLSNVDNVKQLPFSGGILNHRNNYFTIYRYSESAHGDPDFSGGYLRSFVTFTREPGSATWVFDVRSDELGANTPRLGIHINLAGNKVYHQGFKPTASDVGALPISGGELIGNVSLPKNNVGITDSNGKRLLACPDSINCQVGQQDSHTYVTLHGKTATAFRVYYDGGAKNIYHTGNKPTASDVGARPADWLPTWDNVSGKPTTATRWPQWGEVTEKPSSFPPSSHEHAWDQVTGKPTTATRWPKFDEVTERPSTYPPSSHSHSWESITEKPSTFPPSSHSHSDYEIPPGIVTMFAGTESQVPGGWQLCNGSGETSNGIKVPDLRNRFIVGSGSTYDPGSTGGNTSATTSSSGNHSHTVTVNSDGAHSHTVTVNSTTLSVSQTASHNHSIKGYRLNSTGKYYIVGVVKDGFDQSKPDNNYTAVNEVKSGSSGSSNSHTHSASSNSTGSHTHSASTNSTGAHTHTVNTLPPYYALAYIIKL